MSSIDKFNKFLRRCNKLNKNLEYAARCMIKEVSGGVNVSYQLNSYAFYTKGLTAIISNSMVQIKST